MEHNKNHLQLLNINRSRQFSKDKTKTQMALYTISTELNKIKNISKRKRFENISILFARNKEIFIFKFWIWKRKN